MQPIVKLSNPSHQATDSVSASCWGRLYVLKAGICRVFRTQRNALVPSRIKRYFHESLFGNTNERTGISSYFQKFFDNMVSSGRAEAVRIKGEEGDLHGYLHKGNPEQATRKVVLFLSATTFPTENQSLHIVESYTHHGVDVLNVNYRGYGRSEGVPSEGGLYNDAKSMLNYLLKEKKYHPANILIHGYSLGAPVATYLAKNASSQEIILAGLLLDRPMPSMSKAVRAHRIPAQKIIGQIAKRINGAFSIKDNIDTLPKDTPIMLLSDGENMGAEGEILRAALSAKGYEISGTRTSCVHYDSKLLMSENIHSILKKFRLSEPCLK